MGTAEMTVIHGSREVRIFSRLYSREYPEQRALRLVVAFTGPEEEEQGRYHESPQGTFPRSFNRFFCRGNDRMMKYPGVRLERRSPDI
jgi:hypothetical protein